MQTRNGPVGTLTSLTALAQQGSTTPQTFVSEQPYLNSCHSGAQRVCNDNVIAHFIAGTE